MGEAGSCSVLRVCLCVHCCHVIEHALALPCATCDDDCSAVVCGHMRPDAACRMCMLCTHQNMRKRRHVCLHEMVSTAHMQQTSTDPLKLYYTQATMYQVIRSTLGTCQVLSEGMPSPESAPYKRLCHPVLRVANASANVAPTTTSVLPQCPAHAGPVKNPEALKPSSACSCPAYGCPIMSTSQSYGLTHICYLA